MIPNTCLNRIVTGNRGTGSEKKRMIFTLPHLQDP